MDNKMIIRLAEAKDYKELIGLLKQLNPDDPEPTGLEEKAFHEILESPYLHLIVAEQEKKLVSSCFLNVIPNMTRGGQPYAVIENVITDEGCRNQGIGKSLMGFAVTKALDAGCYKVMLLTGRKDKAVNGFYKKCGFDPDSKQAFILKP
jgi:GNAT superfamily N-acetyltransferase